MSGPFFETSPNRAALFLCILWLLLGSSGWFLQAAPDLGTPKGQASSVAHQPGFETSVQQEQGLSSDFASRLPLEINFGAKANRPFRVHAELERWARNHNLLLVPDSPMRNLQDGLAWVVQTNGLEFSLRMPKDVGRAWLYLDLVSYRPLGRYEFSRVRWLDIYANGILLEVLYQGGGKFLKTPYRLAIDREHAPAGVVHIELRPSPGDGAWAIWDAFMSRYQE